MQTGALPTTTPTRRLHTGTKVLDYAILVGSSGMRGYQLAEHVAFRLQRQGVPAMSVDADDAIPAVQNREIMPVLYGPRATMLLHGILRTGYTGRAVGLAADVDDGSLTDLAGYEGVPVETRLRSLDSIADACMEALERPERAYLC